MRSNPTNTPHFYILVVERHRIRDALSAISGKPGIRNEFGVKEDSGLSSPDINRRNGGTCRRH